MKKRIIACVLACAMLLMGTGYAYWTDTINLTATADTGDLEVKFLSSYADGKFSNYEEDFNGNDNDEKFRDVSGSATVTDNDILSLSLNNMYPGYGQSFYTTVKNNGTLAARLGKITQANNANSDAGHMLGISITAKILDVEYFLVKKWGGGYAWIPVDADLSTVDLDNDGSCFMLDGKQFVRLSDFDVALGTDESDILFLDTENASGILGDASTSEMIIKISIAMDKDVEGLYTTGSSDFNKYTWRNDASTENQNVTINLGFVWDQYNTTFVEDAE